MELQHHKFGYSGSGMNFAVFSDDACRISYVESIAIPIGHTHVELYGIEPGARTKWIVVKQLDGHKATLKVFLRQNEKFLENEIDDLPQQTRSQIVRRFPHLAAEEKPPLASKELGKAGRSKGKKPGQRAQKAVAPAAVTIEKRPRGNRPINSYKA